MSQVRTWWTSPSPQIPPGERLAGARRPGSAAGSTEGQDLYGDSDHRDEYSLTGWTDEVIAVADHGGVEGPVVVVGHSMGGFVTIATAALHADRLEGAIVCDSPVTAPDAEIDAARMGSAFGAPRTYASEAEALARFRTVPPQDHYLPYVLDHVARRSLRRVEGGWRWKFDRQVFAQFAGGMRSVALPYLSQVRCRLALLRSEHGLVTEDIGADMYEQLGRVAPVIEIAEAGHHAVLDQPLLLLTALRTLAADWDQPRTAAPTRLHETPSG